MRYDRTIYFCQNGATVYNSATGNYTEGTPIKTACLASVTNTSEEMQILVYGKLKDRSLAIQLRQHYNDPFDYIEIGSKKYGVDSSRKLRAKHTFIVSEV